MRRGLALLLLVAFVAGCGGGGGDGPPRMHRSDAQPLIDLAARVAREGECAQRRDIPLLQRRAILLVNRGRLPPALAEHLVSAVNALAAERPGCLPVAAPAPAVSATPTTPAAPQPKPKPHEHPPPHRHPPHHHRDGHGHDHGDDG